MDVPNPSPTPAQAGSPPHTPASARDVPPDSPVEAGAAESLYDYMTGLDADRQVLHAKGAVLLLPTEQVFQMLNTSWKEVWESSRRDKPFLPVFKTIVKATTGPASPPSCKTLDQIERAVSDNISFRAGIMALTRLDYWWPPAAGWLGLFSGALFSQKPASDFWVDFTRQAMALNGRTLPGLKGARAKMLAYANSPLIEQFGCPDARNMLNERIGELNDEALISSDRTIQQAMTADAVCALMRIAAWLIADMAIAHWDAMVQDDMTDKVPLESMIPTLSPETGKWSNPIGVALAQMARKAGHSENLTVATFLGKLWASSNKSADPASQIRLVRNWLQMQPGRPKFSSMLELAKAVVDAQAEREGLGEKAYEADYWLSAAILRFAETIGRVRVDLSKLGFSDELITSIMSAYASEYRVALAALGKPIPD